MEKFISLTHANGRALVNVRYLIGAIEHAGKVYVATQGGGEPMVVLHTYDEIVEMINNF